NTAPPSFVSIPASRTVLAGASPILVVQATGTLPLQYQWTSNSVTLPGATTALLAVSNVPATTTFGITVRKSYGNTNKNIVLPTATPPAGYVTTVMGDHPSALWRMNDGSGQPTLDSAGVNDGAYNASGVTYGSGTIPGESGGATCVTF